MLRLVTAVLALFAVVQVVQVVHETGRVALHSERQMIQYCIG